MLDILITIIVVTAIICIWIILYDSNRFVVKEHKIKDSRIKKPFRAVVIADLHNKKYGKDNEHLLAAIDECKPDIILVAGDILTAKPGKTLDTAVHFVKELTAKYPVYYGNGNHEHRLMLYPKKYGDMGERYHRALAETSVIHLINSHVNLDEYGISVYGAQIDRFYYKRFRTQVMEADYMKGILGEPDATKYTVLLAHNPDYFPQYAWWGADFVCAGHVHGGLVRVPFWGKGVASPKVSFFPKYDGGIFTEGKSTMLLSRGLGVHSIPIRMFNPGEVLVVDFEPEVQEEMPGQ